MVEDAAIENADIEAMFHRVNDTATLILSVAIDP
jgi:hypothetical protein